MRKQRFFYKIFAVALAPFMNPKYQHLYKSGRRVGNTTRLVDMFVQDFFTRGKIQVYDHYGTKKASERVFNLVIKRLNSEHGIERNDIKLDHNRLTLERKKFIMFH